jgi:CheY-like chemotaxis protein/HPt (histidine-containing phosphotransfer) domain-containing protein
MFRILIVDDEPDIRRVVERSLDRDRELALQSCASGQEALSIAAEWTPHLILLDVMMPGMDGPTTLSYLQEDPLTAAIPVVFLTARARSQELDYVASLGASGAIAKPFEPKELRTLVRSYLEAASRPAADHPTDPASEDERERFRTRMQADAVRLHNWRAHHLEATTEPSDLEDLHVIVHKLAGASGMFGFDLVSRSASAIEQSIVDIKSGRETIAGLDVQVSELVAALGRA